MHGTGRKLGDARGPRHRAQRWLGRFPLDSVLPARLPTPLSALLDRLRPALADRYEIDREVGRGGMATVFRARDVRHERTVAMKVLHPELAEALGAERFLREVRITARLSHPHILPLLDSGEADGLLFYVMPFVEGESLRDRLRREGELPVEEALRLTREVAGALGHAHSLGIVHRDIKPENILLQGGHALVADFGIARAFDDPAQPLTLTGVAVGTPLYMSPEQAHGSASVDGRSDEYSLACVAYELLTGEPPFTGPTPMAITTRKLTESVPPLRGRRTSVSPGVDAALTRALSRAPADRFRTMHEFVEALDAGATASAGAPAGGRARPLGAAAAVAAAAVLVLAGAWAWSVRARPAAPADELTRVAVLPFRNLSPDSNQAYFAEGLTDEVITSLSMVEGMRVASRTSSAVVAAEGVDLPTIGSRLDVESVVEGSVRAADGRLRISARLVRAADETPLWTQTFERPAADAFRIQEEIARAIVEALKGRLGAGHSEAIASGTTDPEAYDLYLQGRSLRIRQTEQTLQRSAEFFRAALARAPDFARAHAGLAEALAVGGFYEYQPAREAFPEAARAAEAAIRLDPNLGSAYATRAYVALYYDWDVVRAEREFLRAIEVEPGSAIAHQWYANLLTVVGRHDEALREFERARAIDPLAPVRNATLVWARYYAGDIRGAVETYHKVIAIDSTYALTFQWGAYALEAAGALDEAVAAHEHAVALSNQGKTFVAGLARGLALRGDAARARTLLAEASTARVAPAFDIAKVHLALGDRAEALRWLERAYDARSRTMVMLRIDPALDALRGDPAFEALVRKVGIPAP